MGDRTAEEVTLGIELKASVLRRILRGDADPPLARVLLLVQALTGRIVDFVELLVDPEEIRSLRAPWRSVKAQRKTAREQLNAQAIVAALETDAYLSRDHHSSEWLAEMLSLDQIEVDETLESLRVGGAIKMRRGRYIVALIATSAQHGCRDHSASGATLGRAGVGPTQRTVSPRSPGILL